MCEVMSEIRFLTAGMFDAEGSGSERAIVGNHWNGDLKTHSNLLLH